MNGRYDSNDLEDVHEGTPAADREISLGTGAMLGIFLGLVLVCGAFFGFGYSMGHKAAPVGTRAAGALGDADAGATGTPADGELKPAPGSSIAQSPEVVVKPSAGVRTQMATAGDTPRPRTPEVTEPTEAAPSPKPAKPYVLTPTTAPTSTAAGSPTVPAASGAGAAPVYVQISAVSHQEDAQLLLTALKRRGYDATVRHSPQDQLLHVQVGPFATKKEADTMKQRLSADGYNAILK